MKLVASMVPPGLLEWRHRIGADGHDEMWEGVLHMNPVPSGKHQDLVIELVTWLRSLGSTEWRQGIQRTQCGRTE